MSFTLLVVGPEINEHLSPLCWPKKSLNLMSSLCRVFENQNQKSESEPGLQWHKPLKHRSNCRLLLVVLSRVGWLVGWVLLISLSSALIDECNSSVIVKSLNHFTALWQMLGTFPLMYCGRDLKAWSSNLALAHVSHHMLCFWICLRFFQSPGSLP